MKRARPSDDEPAGGGGFAFSFAVGGDSSTAAPSAAVPPAAAAPPGPAVAPPPFTSSWDACAALADYTDPISQFRLAAGEVVAVDWHASTPARLRVRRVGGGAAAAAAAAAAGAASRGGDDDDAGSVPPGVLRPLRTARDAADPTYAGWPSAAAGRRAGDGAAAAAEGAAAVVVHDALWAPARSLAATAPPHFSASPLSLEPGLDPLVWPLSRGEFLARFYRRAALCVHAGGGRVAPMVAELGGADVPRLVRAAARVVVWMRDAGSGRMQYLEMPPEQALACYRAGHSLYFNPPADAQRRLVAPVCEELGMGAFGSTADGGFGGDVEVFAVQGRHVSPWHWDAQDNFVVQLAGTKRWSVAAARGGGEPVTNWHPASANAAALAFDARLHGAYAPPGSLQPPPDPPGAGAGAGGADAAAAAGVATFTLRPGSVLYLPAGMWHRVEAEGEGGSLHANVSLSGGGRWAEFVLKRLGPPLWRDALWRQRLATGALPEAYAPLAQGRAGAGAPPVDPAPTAWRHPAHAHAARLLESARALLASLEPQDLLPDALLDAQLPSEGGPARRRGRAEDGGVAAAGGGPGGADGDDAGGDDFPGVHYQRLLVTLPGGPALSKGQRRAASAAAGAGDGQPYAAALASWLAAVRGGGVATAAAGDEGPRLVRSPLVQLELPPDVPPGHTSEPASQPTLVGARAVCGLLGRGTGGLGALDGSVGATEPDYAVPIDVHPALARGALAAVAAMRPCEGTTPRALLAASAAAGGGAAEEALAEAVAALARVLCYTGVLRMGA